MQDAPSTSQSPQSLKTTTVLRFRQQPSSFNSAHLIACAEADGIVSLYSAEAALENDQAQSLYESRDHFFPVNDVQFSQGEPWMATCSNDTLVNMHDINKGQLVRSFIGGHQSFVTKLCFSAAQNMLLSVGADGQLLIYDIRQNKIIRQIFAHPEPLTGVAISRDSTMICTSAYDGYVRLWDFHKSSCIKTLTSETGSSDPISCLRLINDNILIGNTNGQLGFYDLQGRLLKSYVGHTNKKFCIEVNHYLYKGRDSLVGGSEDGNICVWDIQS